MTKWRFLQKIFLTICLDISLKIYYSNLLRIYLRSSQDLREEFVFYNVNFEGFLFRVPNKDNRYDLSYPWECTLEFHENLSISNSNKVDICIVATSLLRHCLFK